MGRRRKHDTHLPRGMFHRHGAYYLVVRGKWTRLGPDFGPALIRYAELVGSAPVVTTVGEAIAAYLEHAANRPKPLSPVTLEGYRYSATQLAPVFGAMRLESLEPAHVYRYLVERGNVQANRDRSLLSAAYTHARRTGAFKGDDPTKGLEYRNPEKPRQRYVTDAELATIVAKASPKLACMIRFAYLTGMRQADVLRVRMEDVREDGIHYTTGKTGVRRLVEWSPELLAVVEDAKRLWRRFGREWLFESKPRGQHAKRGWGPYTGSGLRALWRVARRKTGLLDVTWHDFRGKAGSDVSEADAVSLLAHSDAGVTRRHYRRRPNVKPVR